MKFNLSDSTTKLVDLDRELDPETGQGVHEREQHDADSDAWTELIDGDLILTSKLSDGSTHRINLGGSFDSDIAKREREFVQRGDPLDHRGVVDPSLDGNVDSQR